ncbi:metallophosphoesterase [Psychromonas ossibalaenae]|uniref:metallophosphoesterase n=1 Tax=Psychromonas ossibalaenae TaxID=444922 RepID=UPI00036F0845|nr:metallophosphoesterase [Psychromonas ossibalaenae]
MKLQTKLVFSLLAGAILAGCNSESSSEPPPETQDLQIAFMPDIHFHDVYGDFQDGSFDGLENSISGQGATIRTMKSQLNSTRLFNENYFAMIAALDDIAARGIKYVALPGDFSDDGQPVHMRGLVEIFDQYSREHGIQFFAAPGNHDPVRPFTQPAGKSDYLGLSGKQQGIWSEGAGQCVPGSDNSGQELTPICTEEVQEWGYRDIMDILGGHGFTPQPEYLYFETPYSSAEARSHYRYEKALQEAGYEQRQYEICYEGTGGEYKTAGQDYSHCSMVPDSSYLVEPVEGLWLLAIDANVYRPKPGSEGGPADPGGYEGSSSAGYNVMLSHKQQVIDWIGDVVTAAEKHNKTLISFSHFPMTDFYNGASEDIEDLFGEGAFQLERMPEDGTSKALAATGLSIHVGGHMHFNDTGVKSYQIDGKNHTLFNIQAPSLAGYIPAYKLLTLRPHNQVEVETVIIEEVARFDELFEHYQEEHRHLTEIDDPGIWTKEVLESESYYQFTDWHLKELTRLRFLPDDWPLDMRLMLLNMDGEQMLIMSQIETDFTVCQLADVLDKPLQGCELESNNGDLKQFIKDWRAARIQAEQLALDNGLLLSDFREWSGEELAVDFYRLRNADELAFRDIDPERLPHYQLLSDELRSFEPAVFMNNGQDPNELSVGEVFKTRFDAMFLIMEKFATGQASDNFLIDTEKNTITDLIGTAERDVLQ